MQTLCETSGIAFGRARCRGNYDQQISGGFFFTGLVKTGSIEIETAGGWQITLGDGSGSFHTRPGTEFWRGRPLARAQGGPNQDAARLRRGERRSNAVRASSGDTSDEDRGATPWPIQGLAGQFWRTNETRQGSILFRLFHPRVFYLLAAGEPCREIGDRPRIDVGLVPFLDDGEIGRSRGPGAAPLPAIVPKKISGPGQNVGHAVDEIAVAVPSKSA